jgi:N-dimethylarginine dimethylaminohydrolase
MSVTTAYGGGSWTPRLGSMRDEMRETWGDWGVSSECRRLRAVMLRRPGPELDAIDDFDAVQMRADLDPERARAQHDALADAYRQFDVDVYLVERGRLDKPNSYFVRDLMLMTPEGAIVTRPASTVRAGEERLVAEALGAAGVPILMTVHGRGTFEGADVCWVDRDLCFLAEGLRTNEEGADQVERMLREIGVRDVVRVGLPYGAMHLDGVLAILDRDLAAIWPRRTPYRVVETLRKRGFRFIEVEDEAEAHACLPLNFVALAPGEILMPAGGATMRAKYEAAGVICHPIEIDELIKGGGGIHCMTGFLRRDDL